MFLRGNHLPQRWKDPKLASFTICELGFGTGLNFCWTWSRFLEIAHPRARLHYIACELYPLDKKDIIKALSIFPELGDKARLFIQSIPFFHPGMYELRFANGRICLSLYWGDSKEMLQNLSPSRKVDSWFLDGFSPAVNPEMWSKEIFFYMKKLSHDQSSFSSYSAASIVRKRLQQAGFEVHKTKGFGSKRDMITGHLKQNKPPPPPSLQTNKTSFVTAKHNNSLNTLDAIVIGSGIAGSCIADSLAERGKIVLVIEREKQEGMGASSQETGIAHPLIHRQSTSKSRLSTAGFFYLLNYIQKLLSRHNKNLSLSHCGVLQLLPNIDQDHFIFYKDLCSRIDKDLVQYLSKEESKRQCGFSCSSDGLFFPQGIKVSIPKICKAALDHPNITVQFCQEAFSFHQEKRENKTISWNVRDKNKNLIASSSVLIFACAYDLLRFPLFENLPLKKVRGQTFDLSCQKEFDGLQCVVSYGGYIIPLDAEATLSQERAAEVKGRSFRIGTVFEESNHDPNPIQEQNERMYAQLLERLHGLEDILPSKIGRDFSKKESASFSFSKGRVGFRTSAPDHLPICGPVPDLSSLQEELIHERRKGIGKKNFLLRKNALLSREESLPNLQGLFMSTAFGSHGLTFAPLCAEVVAAQVCKEVLPIEKDLAEAIAPQRFVLRGLRHNRALPYTMGSAT